MGGVQGGLRRWRRRTESVEGVKRYVSKSGCCATPPVSERGVEFSPRVHPRSARASPAVTHGVSPLGTVGTGWEVSLFSPSPLIHEFTLRASPAVTHGVSPSGDSGCGSHHKKSGISDKKRPKMGLFCYYMTKVCIVSVANLSQLCTLPLYYLSCILAA